MAQEVKKFLDQKGVELLWSKLSLEDYPNNDTLIAVINAIDKNKADQTDVEALETEITTINSELAKKAPTSHASTATTYGDASASKYGHAMASSTTPKVAGTAAVGSETAKFARGDHIHPAQTSVSGNAGTATKLETARTISLTGDVTGSVSFDGSANASITATVANNSHNHSASNITSGTLAAARLPAATTSAQGAMTAADKTKLNATNIAYGTCSTAAETAEKVITISGNTNWTLAAGSMITVKFSATNTAQNPTFNVNSTGAKSVWYNIALITTSDLGYAGTANRPMNFIYDGTQYVFVGWSYDTNTTYTNFSLGQGYATCNTAAETAAKMVALSTYALTPGGIVAIKFKYDVPANATLNINGRGAKLIYYKGAAITDGVIKAGDTATFIYSNRYHLISIDSSGSALTSDPREAEEEAPELSAVPINADTLGGILASEYATKEWVLNNIRFASEVNW